MIKWTKDGRGNRAIARSPDVSDRDVKAFILREKRRKRDYDAKVDTTVLEDKGDQQDGREETGQDTGSSKEILPV